MREVYLRLKAETPRFFKRLRNMALSISVACTSAALFYAQLPAEVTSVVPSSMVKTLAIAGIIAAFIAQLTKVDSTTQP